MSAAIDLVTVFLTASIELRPLAAALARLKHVVPRRSALPVLEYLLIRVSGHQLTLIATDLNVTAQITLPAEGTSDGELLVPMNVIGTIVRPTRGRGNVVLSGNHLTINGANYTLPTIDPTTFPALPELPHIVEAVLQRATLARMLRATAYAMSTDETRPHLAGALLERADGELRLVATDGHRLAVASTASAGAEFKCIVVHRGIEELARLVALPGGPVSIHRTPDRIWFVSGEDYISAKVVDATYPSWEQVVPSIRSGSITMRRVELLTALAAVAPKGSVVGVKLSMNSPGSGVELTVEREEGAVAQAFVVAEVSGGVPAAMGFNALYLREMVEAVGEDTMVTLGVERELDPVKVTGEDGSVHVVMPMGL